MIIIGLFVPLFSLALPGLLASPYGGSRLSHKYSRCCGTPELIFTITSKVSGCHHSCLTQQETEAQNGRVLCLKSCSEGASTGPQVCRLAEPLIVIGVLGCRVNGTGRTVAKGPGTPQLRERPWRQTV